MLCFFNCLKKELNEILRSKANIILFGFLFVTVGLILISFFNVPLLFGNFKILPGGGLQIFFCYLFTVLFFFLIGATVSFLYKLRYDSKLYVKKAITDLMISYVLRSLWIILFIGYSSFVVTLVFIIASAFFIIFALICTRKISRIISLIEALLLVEEAFVIFMNVKMILIN